jgi:hypothetical protein
VTRTNCIAIFLFLCPLYAQAGFPIPPTTVRLQIEELPVSVTISGSVAASHTDSGERALIHLDTGLGDLQRQIASILRARLNQDNRCGDRISVEDATLTPAPPASRLIAHVHYEKWGCAKAFGKELVKKLIGGNAVMELRLSPSVESGTGLRLHAELVSVDADGQLGEALRSGSMGDALKEKIRQSVEHAVEKSARLSATLPPAVREIAALRSAEFAAAPDAILHLILSAEAQLTSEQLRTLSAQLKAEGR